MKKLIILLILCLLNITTNAQSWQWAKQNTSGCMIYEGSSYDFAVTNPVVAADAFGNVYMLGTYTSYDITFGAFTLHSHGFSDGFLVKYDSMGNVKWLKGISGISPYIPLSSFPYINANSIATDPNGNIYITGIADDNSVTFGTDTLHFNYHQPCFLFKIDSNGNYKWGQNTGGIAVRTDTKGYIYVIGNSFHDSVVLGDITLHAIDSYNQYFAKYDSIGTIIWGKAIGTLDIITFDYSPITSITIDTFQNVVLGGYGSNIVIFDTTTLSMVGTAGYQHLFYAKYNSNGNLLWAKSAGGNSNENLYPNSITTDNAGNIYMLGNTGSTSDTIIFGASTLITPRCFLVKLNGMGSFEWLKASDSFNVYLNPKITHDDYSNIYIGGQYSGQVIIGLDTLTSLGATGSIIIKFDTTGSAACFITESQADITSIATNAMSNFFTVGKYWENGFNLGTTTLYNPETTCANIFIAKIDTSFALSVSKNTIVKNDIFIYPNPTNGLVNITSSLFIDNSTVTVYNMVGKLVFTNKYATAYTNQFQIDLHNLPDGEYIISIKTNNSVYNNKITLLHDK